MNIERLQRLAVEHVEDLCVDMHSIVRWLDPSARALRAIERFRWITVRLILQGKPESPCERCHVREADICTLCLVCEDEEYQESVAGDGQ